MVLTTVFTIQDKNVTPEWGLGMGNGLRKYIIELTGRIYCLKNKTKNKDYTHHPLSSSHALK